jgi:hypothetical protein
MKVFGVKQMVSMRNIMNAVLVEGVDEDIFAKMLNLFNKLPEDKYRYDIIEDVKYRITNAVKYAKTTLVKKDRIIWYYKVERLQILSDYATSSPELQSYYNSLLTDFSKKAGEHFSPMRPSYFTTDLPHFLSLPIQKIQDYKFLNQTPLQIYSDFADYETEWKAEANGLIAQRPEDKIILDFKNGWVWMMLDRASCPDEAEAMGHCGNSPRSHTKDKILSLRRKVPRGNVTLWKPSLTFIMRDDGVITEMKGRGNEKPAPKYHAMIVALLKLPLIKGILGGGYLPEKNFSLTDLPDEERLALLDENPELQSAYDYWTKTRAEDSTFYTKLQDELSAHGLGYTIDQENGVVIIQEKPRSNYLRELTYIDDKNISAIYNIETWDFEAVPALSYLDDLSVFVKEFRMICEKSGDNDPEYLRDFILTHRDNLEKLRKKIIKVVENKAAVIANEVMVNTNSYRISDVYAHVVGDKVRVSIPATDAARLINSATEAAGEDDDYDDFEGSLEEGRMFVNGHATEDGGDNYDDDNLSGCKEDAEELIEEMSQIIPKIMLRYYKTRGNSVDQRSFDF